MFIYVSYYLITFINIQEENDLNSVQDNFYMILIFFFFQIDVKERSRQDVKSPTSTFHLEHALALGERNRLEKISEVNKHHTMLPNFYIYFYHLFNKLTFLF